MPVGSRFNVLGVCVVVVLFLGSSLLGVVQAVDPDRTLPGVSPAFVNESSGSPVDAVSISSWSSTSTFPVTDAGQACSASSAAEVYCVGGQDTSGGGLTSSVYSTSLSSSGVGSWGSTTSYPFPVVTSECAVSSGVIYCVGGYSSSTSAAPTSVYAASLSGTSVGAWSATTAYPTPVTSTSCVTESGEIYCVGGVNPATDDATSSVYGASLEGSGVGSWSATSQYPVAVFGESCSILSGYIYCIGGDSGAGSIDSVYYASVSGSGIGTWTTGTAYPESSEDLSCVGASSNLFCIGGYNEGSEAENSEVYYAPVSPGLGSWTSLTSYPTSISGEGCVVSSAVIYCVAGFTSSSSLTNAVYYSSIGGTSSGLTVTLDSSPSSCDVNWNGADEPYGTVISNIPTGTVEDIASISCSGYSFSSWSTTAGTLGSTTASSTTLTVNGNGALFATYQGPTKYSVTLDPSPSSCEISWNGVNEPSGTEFTNIPSGTVEDIGAVSCSWETFSSWSTTAGALGSSTATSTSLTVTSTGSLSATWSATTWQDDTNFTQPETTLGGSFSVTVPTGVFSSDTISVTLDGTLLTPRSGVSMSDYEAAILHYFNVPMNPSDIDAGFAVITFSVSSAGLSFVPLVQAINAAYNDSLEYLFGSLDLLQEVGPYLGSSLSLTLFGFFEFHAPSLDQALSSAEETAETLWSSVTKGADLVSDVVNLLDTISGILNVGVGVLQPDGPSLFSPVVDTSVDTLVDYLHGLSGVLDQYNSFQIDMIMDTIETVGEPEDIPGDVDHGVQFILTAIDLVLDSAYPDSPFTKIVDAITAVVDPAGDTAQPSVSQLVSGTPGMPVGYNSTSGGTNWAVNGSGFIIEGANYSDVFFDPASELQVTVTAVGPTSGAYVPYAVELASGINGTPTAAAGSVADGGMAAQAKATFTESGTNLSASFVGQIEMTGVKVAFSGGVVTVSGSVSAPSGGGAANISILSDWELLASGSAPGGKFQASFEIPQANGTLQLEIEAYGSGSLGSVYAQSITLYPVSVSEVGLSSGTLWSPTVGGISLSSTLSELFFYLPNGTYTYSIAPISGEVATPSSGSVTVDGGLAKIKVTFTMLELIPDPDQGPVGATYLVTGSGFTKSSGATVSFNGVDQAPSTCSNGKFNGTTVTTNGSGAFVCTFTVPSESAGYYSLVGTDVATSATNTTIFTVTVPKITPSPSQDPVGATYTVSGSGFSLSTGLTISFKGVLQTPSSCSTGTFSGTTITTASGTGGFKCTFTVPSESAGSYSIVGKDKATGLTSARTFTVTVPTIALDPDQGPVGAKYKVTGTGFSALSGATVSFNGMDQAPSTCSNGKLNGTTVTTNGSGAFVCTFTVPSESAGSHSIVGENTMTNTLTVAKTFRVTVPTITLNPSRGAVGATYTVSGSGFSLSTGLTISFKGVLQTPSSCSTGTFSGTTITTASGTGGFKCTFTVPSESAGSYSIVGKDKATGLTSAQTFTVM
jgi:hypothetical protein